MNLPSGRSKGQEARSKKARSKRAVDLLSVPPHHFLLLASCFLLLASCFLLLAPHSHRSCPIPTSPRQSKVTTASSSYAAAPSLAPGTGSSTRSGCRPKTSRQSSFP